jgi:hypothetical protein
MTISLEATARLLKPQLVVLNILLLVMTAPNRGTVAAQERAATVAGRYTEGWVRQVRRWRACSRVLPLAVLLRMIISSKVNITGQGLTPGLSCSSERGTESMGRR